MNRIRAITGENFDPAAIQLQTLCQVSETTDLAALAFELQSNMVIKFKPKEVAFEESVIDEKDAWRLVSSNRDGGGVFYFVRVPWPESSFEVGDSPKFLQFAAE